MSKLAAKPLQPAEPGLAAGGTAALLTLLCLWVFGTLAIDVITQGAVFFDPPVIQAVRAQTSTGITAFMMAATFWGSAAALITLAVAATVYLRRRPLPSLDSLLPAFVVLGAWILNTLLKESFDRLRPGDNPLVYESSFSFPSGHAMISLAFYGAVAFLIWKYIASPRGKWLSIAGLGVLVLIIGLSRIYLGAHYPSDVVAGYAAGGLWLLLCLGGLRALRGNDSGG